MADYFDERSIDPATENRNETDTANIMRLLVDFNLFTELGLPDRTAPPASKKVVESLPDHKVKESGEQCQVCLKEYEKDEVIKELPCKHAFHFACISAWLSKTNSCPLCRHELPTDDEYYEAYRKEKIRAKEREEDIENLHNSMFT